MMKRRDCRDLALSGNDLFIDATYLLLLLAPVLAGQDGARSSTLGFTLLESFFYFNYFAIIFPNRDSNPDDVLGRNL